MFSTYLQFMAEVLEQIRTFVISSKYSVREKAQIPKHNVYICPDCKRHPIHWLEFHYFNLHNLYRNREKTEYQYF